MRSAVCHLLSPVYTTVYMYAYMFTVHDSEMAGSGGVTTKASPYALFNYLFYGV